MSVSPNRVRPIGDHFNGTYLPVEEPSFVPQAEDRSSTADHRLDAAVAGHAFCSTVVWRHRNLFGHESRAAWSARTLRRWPVRRRRAPESSVRTRLSKAASLIGRPPNPIPIGWRGSATQESDAFKKVARWSVLRGDAEAALEVGLSLVPIPPPR